MTKRGAVIVGVMLGLFVLSFGALGVRALTLGPDAPHPSATEMAARQQAVTTLERSIQVARADVPPTAVDLALVLAIDVSGSSAFGSGERTLRERAAEAAACLAVSAVNGCEACVRTHEESCLKHGITAEQVHDAIRTAAVVCAASLI